MYDKILGNLHIVIDITSKNIEEHYIKISSADTNIPYLYKTGSFNVSKIDSDCMAITFDGEYPSITILMGNTKTITMKTFSMDAKKDFITNEELKKRKLIIMPNDSGYVLFSYASNSILSSTFDVIRPIQNGFRVKYTIFVGTTPISLIGTLDFDGHLNSNILYSETLDYGFIVDETDLRASLDNHYSLMQRLLARKAKKARNVALTEYDYEAYQRTRTTQKKKFE